MTLKIGVVMDPIESIAVYKDTTLAMLVAALKRDFTVFYMLPGDLYLDGHRPLARARQLLHASYDPEDYYRLGPAETAALGELDAILMRKDPPFDNEYIYNTYLLEAAEREGALIVNKPQSLRDCNEKVFATQFPQCTPSLLVTSRDDLLREFLAEHKDVVMKPLDGMGGASIFRVAESDPNIGVIIETLTEHGQQTIMVQRYLPEIRDGDKRILLIDGEPIPYALARVPLAGESRGNLAAGGQGEARPLSDRDRWICEQLGPTLKEKGLLFVGLDVIGDYLTEVNVTSPTCIREIDAAYDTDIAGLLMDTIRDKCQRG